MTKKLHKLRTSIIILRYQNVHECDRLTRNLSSFARFGLEGHLLAIDKGLCGLRNSGACYHAKWAASMKQLGFFHSRADPYVWMRVREDHYQYVAVWVDDLFYAGKAASKIREDVRAMGYKRDMHFQHRLLPTRVH